MTEGIIARFRTMAISRAVGARRARARQPDPDAARHRGRDRRGAARSASGPPPSPLEWLGAVGLLALVAFALTWLAVALGLVSQERRGGEQPADAADPAAVPRQRLRADRVDARPAAAGSREYQPFTPIIETLRGLLLGTPIGSSGVARDRVVAGHRARRPTCGPSTSTTAEVASAGCPARATSGSSSATRRRASSTRSPTSRASGSAPSR